MKCISVDHNPARLQLDEVCKDLVEVTIISGVEDIELSPEVGPPPDTPSVWSVNNIADC